MGKSSSDLPEGHIVSKLIILILEPRSPTAQLLRLSELTKFHQSQQTKEPHLAYTLSSSSQSSPLLFKLFLVSLEEVSPLDKGRNSPHPPRQPDFPKILEIIIPMRGVLGQAS